MSNENKDQQLNKDNSGEPGQAKSNSQLPNNDNGETEIPFEIRFQQTVEKVRPYLKNLWALRKKFVIFNAIVLILTLAYLIFLTEPYYDSTVTILPDYGGKESSLGQLGGLASLAGVSVGSGSPTEIYQNLITSESVLAPIIYSKYKTEKFSDSVNLIQYFKIKPDKSLPQDLQKRDMFLKVFNALAKGRLTSDVDRMTKILTVTVKMPEAQLSADVVNKVAESLDNYIRTKRKSYASEQSQYIEKRLMQVKDSLNVAENKLMYFKEQNRMVIQSPALMLEQGRLSRNAEIMNAVYLELSKQLELAKIAEVKDTPVLNIKELAKDPIVKTGPKRLTALIIVLFLSVLFSGTYFAFRSTIKKYTSIMGLHSIRIRGKRKTV
ncbi:MAG: Wzz/FepE/Etk N-terminal domain-containing protein [Ignavibacteriaceae bacterium]